MKVLYCMELGEWYNPPFVRVLEVKYCHMKIAHSVSIDVLDEEGRRRRTATIQNLPGGANHLAELLTDNQCHS